MNNQMEIVKISKNSRSDAARKAATHIERGGVVVARADTSYALLALPRYADKAMVQVKTERGNKRYSVFISGRQEIINVVPMQHRLMVSGLLPGAVTVVVGADKPALRCICHKTIRDLAGVCGPLTATSANPSGLPPARNLADIKKYFSNTDFLVLYEGVVPMSLPSTIIDVGGDGIKVLRQGAVQIDL